MKYSLLFSALLLSAVMVGCSDNPIDESYAIIPEGQVDTRTITVGVGDQYGEGALGSRVTVDDSDSAMWYYMWESDDDVLGWDDTGYISQFTMSSLFDNYATFTGDADESATSMRLLYPYDESMIVDGTFTIDLSTQSLDFSNASDSFAQNNLYLTTDLFEIADDAVAGSMNHLLSIVELQITPNNISGDLYLESATIKGLNMNKATVDFTTAEVTVASDDDTIVVEFTNPSKLVNNLKYSLPFSIIPYTASAGDIYSVSLTFTDGSTYGVKLIDGDSELLGVREFSSEFEFPAGIRTPFTLSFNASTDLCAPIRMALADFSASFSTTDEKWYVTDYVVSDASQFSGLKDAITAANSSYAPFVVFENILSVTAEAFKDYDGSFTVEGSIATAVEESAFASASGVTAIDLPTVETVAASAFRDCVGLTELALPSLTDTDVNGDYTYSGLTNIVSLDLESYTAISANATFASNTAMTSLNLPNVVTIDGDETFTNCSALTDFSLPMLSSINGSSVFSGCNIINLDLGSLGDGVTYINPAAFDGATTSATTLTINPDVSANFAVDTDNGTLTFEDNSSITFGAIVLDGYNQYYLADYSSTMEIPTTQTWYVNDSELTADACAGLRDAIELAQTYGKYKNEGPIIKCVKATSIAADTFSSLADVDFTGSYSIELSVYAGSLGENTFNSSALTAIEAPYVTALESGALANTLLTDLTLSCVTSLADSSLSTTTLTDLMLGTGGDGVSTITGQPFDTSNTTGVFLVMKINSSAITISGSKLSWSDSGTSYSATFGQIIEFNAMGDPISTYSASNYPSGDIWYVSDLTVSSASEFAGLKSAITAANNSGTTPAITFEMMMSIPAEAFKDFTGSFSLVLPYVSSLGDSVFSGCTNLKSLDLSEVTSVGAAAFKDCQSLTALSLPSLTDTNVSGGYTYYGLSSVTSLSLPSYTSITGESTFANCPNLSSLTLDNVTAINGNNMFSGCTSLTSLVLPQICTLTGSEIFAGCTFTTLDFGYTGDGIVTYIDVNAFSNCDISGTTLNLEKAADRFINYTLSGNTLNISGTTYTFAAINFEEKQPSTLVEYDAESYPSVDTWYIEDTSATADDFVNLKLAILSANSAGVEPTIVFTNMLAIPASAFCGTSTSYYAGVFSVELEVATSIGSTAFAYITKMNYIHAYEVTSLSTLTAAFTTLDRIYMPKLVTLPAQGLRRNRSTEIDLPLLVTINNNAFNDSSTTAKVYKLGYLGDGVSTITNGAGQTFASAANADCSYITLNIKFASTFSSGTIDYSAKSLTFGSYSDTFAADSDFYYSGE
ncbi:MAG: leucine-rich repeat domain-containing protein [Rikenellaceae bacterium]